MNNVRQPIPIIKFQDIPLDDPPPTLLASRVGDVMQLADALRMALMLADLAVTLAEQIGANSCSAARLRDQICALRGSL